MYYCTSEREQKPNIVGHSPCSNASWLASESGVMRGLVQLRISRNTAPSQPPFRTIDILFSTCFFYSREVCSRTCHPTRRSLKGSTCSCIPCTSNRSCERYGCLIGSKNATIERSQGCRGRSVRNCDGKEGTGESTTNYQRQISRLRKRVWRNPRIYRNLRSPSFDPY